MNSLGLVSACAGLDYELTLKSSRVETGFMHYSVLIIFHAPVRTAFTCAFTRSSFMLGLSPSSNCGGSSAAVQIIAASAIYLSLLFISSEAEYTFVLSQSNFFHREYHAEIL